MYKIFFYLFALIIFVTSCSSDDIKIKKALRTSIPELLRDEYEYESHILLETILKNNLTDSISRMEFEIMTMKKLMKNDSIRLLSIRSNMEDCRNQRANTLSYLRSTYTGLIRDYEKMEDEIVGELENKLARIDKIESKIKFIGEEIKRSKSPVVYYKIKHSYKMRGSYQDTIIYINSNFELTE